MALPSATFLLQLLPPLAPGQALQLCVFFCVVCLHLKFCVPQRHQSFRTTFAAVPLLQQYTLQETKEPLLAHLFKALSVQGQARNQLLHPRAHRSVTLLS